MKKTSWFLALVLGLWFSPGALQAADLAGTWLVFHAEEGSDSGLEGPEFFSFEQSGDTFEGEMVCDGVAIDGEINADRLEGVIHFSDGAIILRGRLADDRLDGRWTKPKGGETGVWFGNRVQYAPSDRQCVILTAEVFGVRDGESGRYLMAAEVPDFSQQLMGATLLGPYLGSAPLELTFESSLGSGGGWRGERVLPSGVTPSLPLDYVLLLHLSDGETIPVRQSVDDWEEVESGGGGDCPCSGNDEPSTEAAGRSAKSRSGWHNRATTP
ncbi:MAG: hypothetical protein HQL52_16060 [Magnetococcales bacterium]|nr:hypothetical protein [Magnetococcales bacterium]